MYSHRENNHYKHEIASICKVKVQEIVAVKCINKQNEVTTVELYSFRL